MYGLEIVQPKQTNLKKLEEFQKNILKQILSLPTNAPDPAIFLENRKPTLTLISFDIELTGHKLFFYCVIMLSTYVVKQSHIFYI
jgi:hypothetical protein